MSEITFSLGTTKPQQEHWPLRLAVIAEFIPRDFTTGQPSAVTFRHAIDKDNFNETMAKMGMQLKFEIENPFTNTPKHIPITVPLNVIKAFDPDHVLKAIPQLGDIAAARSILEEVRYKKVSPETARSHLQPLQLPPDLAETITISLVPGKKLPRGKQRPPQPPQEKDDSTVDKILDMVDTGESTPSDTESRDRAKGALDAFLGKGETASGKVNTKAIQNAIAEADALLNTALDRIMHHPEFKRVERLWRGLKFLVDRTNFRKNIKIEILHASRESLQEIFDAQLYQPEYDATTETPLAAAVAAFEFSHDAPDIELLRHLSEKAAGIPFMVVGTIGTEFWGIKQATQFAQLPALTTHLESPQYTKFRGLRDDESTRWLTLAFNRFLVRAPYGQDGDAGRGYTYGEATADYDDLPWGNPVWAVAAALTRSQKRVGWATEIGGRRPETILENLPVQQRALTSGELATCSLEYLLPEERVKECEKCGIMPLVCDNNTDMVYCLTTPTVRHPKHDPDPATADKYRLMASLPYQMYAGTIARFINRHYAELVTGGSEGEIEERVQQALAALNVTTGTVTESGTVTVELQPGEQTGAGPQLDIAITSPPSVLFGRVTVHLGLPIKR